LTATAAQVEVKERPILFSGAMVRAILEGRKTQTRRVMVAHECGRRWVFSGNVTDAKDHRHFHSYWVDIKKGIAYTGEFPVRSPYGGVRSRLWVRETFAPAVNEAGDILKKDPPVYRADNPVFATGGPDDWRWTPSIFMPRWASRITLEITNVRVERLQEISEADAIAEGLTQWTDPPRVSAIHYGESVSDVWETDPRKAYARLWDTINAKRGFAWDENCWVWVVEFKKL
jgi:hypothetical protein